MFKLVLVVVKIASFQAQKLVVSVVSSQGLAFVSFYKIAYTQKSYVYFIYLLDYLTT